MTSSNNNTQTHTKMMEEPSSPKETICESEGLQFLFSLLSEQAYKSGIPFKDYTYDMVETLALLNYNRKTESNIREVFRIYHKDFAHKVKEIKIKTSVFQLLHHFVTHKRPNIRSEIVPQSFQGKLPPPGKPVYLPHMECYQDLKTLFSRIHSRNIRLIERDRKMVWEFVPNTFLK